MSRRSTTDAAGPVLGQLERRSVISEAVKLLQDLIISGELLPGERLPTERQLAEQLGISRPSVREAVRALVQMNVLESRQGSGTFVRSLDTSELMQPMRFVLRLAGRALDELFQARLMIEPSVAALAAEHATDEQLAAIEACIADGGAVLDAPQLVDQDERLHLLIARAAHNSVIEAVLQSIAVLTAESRELTVRLADVQAQSGADHAAIVAAITAHDAEAARAAMDRHLRNVAAAAARAAGG